MKLHDSLVHDKRMFWDQRIMNCMFELSYLLSSCRTSPAEFVVSRDRYYESLKRNYSIGMRFKMRFEGDEAPERRYGLDLLSFKHFIYAGSKLTFLSLITDSVEQLLASAVCRQCQNLCGQILTGDL